MNTTRRWIVASAFLFLLFASRSTAAATKAATDTAKPAQPLVRSSTPEWQPKVRDEHQTVWQSVRYFTNTITGSVRSTTNSYVEIGTGLNRRDATGQWQPSNPSFQITPMGAEANLAGHRVTLAGNINTAGAVQIEKDGVKIQGHPLCIAYYDPADGRSELIAELKDAVGWLVASNEVVFSNCFDGLRASIRYRNSPAGVEQDLLLHERPSVTPQEIGFSDRARLELFTEWIGDTPLPQKDTRVLQREKDAATRLQIVEPDFSDSTLTFGDGNLRMAQGRAFSTGDESAVTNRQSSIGFVPVGKRFEIIDGRRILIEAVPVRHLQPMLNKLPVARFSSVLTNAAVRDLSKTNGVQVAAALTRPLPAKRLAQTKSDAHIQTAASLFNSPIDKLNSEFAVVLDWQLLNGGSQSNYTFYGTNTYRVTAPVNLTGTTRIEGGTVVKFDPWTSSASLSCYGPVIFDTSDYRPAIFTAKDDNSVGETLPDGGGAPAWWYYGGGYLYFYGSSDVDVKHLRMKYSDGSALSFYSTSTSNRVSHCQFVYSWGLFANGNSLSLLNVLFDNVPLPLEGLYFDARAEHVTARNGWSFADDFGTGGSINVVNSLIVNVADCWVSCPPDPSTYWTTADEPLFQTVGAGGYYLTDGTHRNVGTPNIDPGLKTDLARMTTYPPEIRTGTAMPNLVLGPRTIGDSDALDRGYHYPILDYALDSLSVEDTTVLLTNGVVVSPCNWYGFLLKGGELVSEGTPDRPNRIVPYTLVQEASIFWNSISPASTTTIYPYPSPSQAPNKVQLRFTLLDKHQYGDYANHLYSDPWSAAVSRFALRDCEVIGGAIQLWADGSSGAVYGLTNSAFQNVNLMLYDSPNLFLFNNLFSFSVFAYGRAEDSTWVMRDNVFNYSRLYDYCDYLPLHSHNAFVACYYECATTVDDQMLPPGAGEFVLSDLAFQKGPFGNYYLPASETQLIDHGSRPGSDAGLFHYTTRIAANSKESGQVDIGLHYIGANSVNLPINTDGDGLADYIEDMNGNGISENTEPNYNLADTDRDGLSDGFEVLVSHTDPTTRDTGNAGRSDAEKDGDGDGITNREESQLGTNPDSADVAPPMFDPPSGAYTSSQIVRILCRTLGATVRYTLNGSEPTTSSPEIMPGAEIPGGIAADTTVKAKAWKTGLNTSPTATAEYLIAVATPTFSPNGGAFATSQDVIVQCPTAGATIRYTTDGSEPNGSSLVIASGNAITITSSKTLKAKAWRGSQQSGTRSAAFYLRNAPANDNFASAQLITGQSGTVYGSTFGATAEENEPTWTPGNGRSIWYSFTPTASGRIAFDTTGSTYGGTYGSLEIYTGTALDGLTLVASQSGNETAFDVTAGTTYRIRASHYIGHTAGSIVLRWGSAVATVATPTIEPGTGTYLNSQTVSINCATPSATIHYTTDGTEPTESHPQLVNGSTITIRQNTTLKAKAWKQGLTPSSVATAAYILNPNAPNPTATVAAPTFNPGSQDFASSIAVTLNCTDPAAVIRYTTDGRTPDQSSVGVSPGSSVNFNASAVLRARAYKAGSNPSAITQAAYAKQGTDTDLDGLADTWEQQHGANLLLPDANAESTEPYAHGLSNQTVFENPSVLVADNYSSAGDGVPDWWKLANGYSVSTPATTIADNGLSLLENYQQGLSPSDAADRPGFLPPLNFGIVHGPQNRLYLILHTLLDGVTRYRLFCKEDAVTGGQITVKDIPVADAQRAATFFEIPTPQLVDGFYSFQLQALTEQQEVTRRSGFVGTRTKEILVCENDSDPFLGCQGNYALRYESEHYDHIGVALSTDLYLARQNALRQRLRASSQTMPYQWEDFLMYASGTLAQPEVTQEPPPEQWWGVGAFRYSDSYSSGAKDPYFPYLCDNPNYSKACFFSSVGLDQLSIYRENPNFNTYRFVMDPSDPEYPWTLSPNGLYYVSFKIKQGNSAAQILTPTSPVSEVHPLPGTEFYVAQEVEQPILRVSEYYFDGRYFPLDDRAAGWYGFFASYPLGQFPGSVPAAQGWIQSGFFADPYAVSQENPLIIGMVGKPVLLNGWARLPVLHADSTPLQPNFFTGEEPPVGWIEQDFNQAFLCDPATGDVPRTQENNVGTKKKIDVAAIDGATTGSRRGGLLSPSLNYELDVSRSIETPERGADFTPTNSGKYIITTKPDQNGNYGEVTVYAGILESQDRFFHGAIPLDFPVTQAKLSIRNVTTGQDMGSYADVFGSQPKFHIYNSEDDIFSETEVQQYRAGTLPGLTTDQPVVFVKDTAAKLLHFYTVFDNYGDVEVRLTHSGGEFLFGETLKPHADISDMINHLHERVKSLEMEEIDDPPLISDVFAGPDDWGNNGMLAAQQPGTMLVAGPYVAEAAENNPDNLILVVNDDNDDNGTGHTDFSDTVISSTDDDIIRLTLRRMGGLPANSGTITLTVSSGNSVRIFRSDGMAVLTSYSVNLASPSGDLVGLASGTTTLFLEGLIPNADVTITLTHRDAAGTELAHDEVHLKVVSRNFAFLFRPMYEGAYRVPGTKRLLHRVYAANGRYTYGALNLAPIGILDTLIHRGEPMPVENRNLVTKTLIAVFKSNINPNFSLVKGIVDGVWDGIRSDISGLRDLSYLALHPFERGAEIFNGLKDLLQNEPFHKIGTMLENALDGLMTSAEKSILIGFSQRDSSDENAVNAYVTGYAFGLICEQIAFSATGAGIVAKIGAVTKGVMAASKVGKVILTGVSAALRFKGVTIAFAKNFITSTRGAKAASRAIREINKMADRLAREIKIGGKSAADILSDRIQRLDIAVEEINKYCNDLWNDIGFRANARLADFMEAVLGRSLTEAELRGFLRIYGRIMGGSLDSDHYRRMLEIFRTESPSGKQRLANAFANYANPASVPDKDLLTLAYVVKKEVGPNDHPALLQFKNRAEFLAPEQGTSKLREGMAAARYENFSGLNLQRSANSEYDFVAGQTRVAFDGPALVDLNTGTFVPDPTGHLYPNWHFGFENSIRQNLVKMNQGLFDRIVVDCWGLTSSQLTYLQTFPEFQSAIQLGKLIIMP